MNPTQKPADITEILGQDDDGVFAYYSIDAVTGEITYWVYDCPPFDGAVTEWHQVLNESAYWYPM